MHIEIKNIDYRETETKFQSLMCAKIKKIDGNASSQPGLIRVWIVPNVLQILHMHVASVTTQQLNVMHAIIAVLIMHSMEPMNWSLLPQACIAVFITVRGTPEIPLCIMHVYLKMFGIGLT